MAEQISRTERRQHARALERMAAEAQARARSGKWPPWRRLELEPGTVGFTSWTRAIHTAHENGLFAVLVRTLETPAGTVEHAAIRNTAGTDITWRDKQRIKAELFGAERYAVEVFPPESRLIDARMMYHLWIYPPDYVPPFDLADDEV